MNWWAKFRKMVRKKSGFFKHSQILQWAPWLPVLEYDPVFKQSESSLDFYRLERVSLKPFFYF